MAKKVSPGSLEAEKENKGRKENSVQKRKQKSPYVVNEISYRALPVLCVLAGAQALSFNPPGTPGGVCVCACRLLRFVEETKAP